MADGHDFQGTDFSCGAAALRMALHRAGMEPPSESALMDELDLDLQGTHVDALAAAVARRGLDHRHWHGDVGLRDLADLLEEHVVMVCYQSRVLRVGHFALLEDVAEDHVHLADPWFGPGTRLPLQEFLACWRSEPKGSPPRPRWLLAIRRV